MATRKVRPEQKLSKKDINSSNKDLRRGRISFDQLDTTSDDYFSMKSDRTSNSAVSTSTSSKVQTVKINGREYQVVTAEPETLQALAASKDLSQFVSGSSWNSKSSSQSGQDVSVRTASSTSASNSVPRATEDAAKKREMRLMKNREAARECRNKKKEYIRCLENRVAVLENQNKALIEELKSLKEMYAVQKS